MIFKLAQFARQANDPSTPFSGMAPVFVIRAMLIVQKLGVLSPPAQPQTTNSGTGWKPRLKHSHSKKTTFAVLSLL
jgi:hypothetical protein